MRVSGSNLKTKRELSVSVESLENIDCFISFQIGSWARLYLVRVYYELETEEIVRVRKFSFAGFGKFQLVNILHRNKTIK